MSVPLFQIQDCACEEGGYGTAPLYSWATGTPQKVETRLLGRVPLQHRSRLAHPCRPHPPLSAATFQVGTVLPPPPPQKFTAPAPFPTTSSYCTCASRKSPATELRLEGISNPNWLAVALSSELIPLRCKSSCSGSHSDRRDSSDDDGRQAERAGRGSSKSGWRGQAGRGVRQQR